MALIPKRTKYRRPHRIRYDGLAKGNTKLQLGDYGIQALEGAWITQQQIEAASSYDSLYETWRNGIYKYFSTFIID